VLEQRRLALAALLAHGAPAPASGELLHNDLQRAAVSLCPQIGQVLAQARDAGADLALVSGSGPTVIGLFLPRGGSEDPDASVQRAAQAARLLRGRTPAPVCARPVDRAFARAHSVTQTAQSV
jgi:4-diphosphocytidyl-2-C-methyl-D-erythritol kinase